MLKTRVIPILLLKEQGLVKTKQFKEPKYVGDPINAIKIFNDKEVDELVFLDTTATSEQREPNYKLIATIAGECFMPLSYGGGITTVEQIKKILSLGVEKVILNSGAFTNPNLVNDASAMFGSSTIVVCIDYKKNFWGKSEVYIKAGSKSVKYSPLEYAKKMEELGAGELILSSIVNEGMYKGYDIETLKAITENVNIPVVASGGASKLEDFANAVNIGGASGVAAGSLFVFHGPHKAVLINYPEIKILETILK
jgi:cyclase